MADLKGVCVGAGYFSPFQYDAWQRIPEVRIVAFANRDPDRARAIREKHGLETHYTDYLEMLDREKPDFVDVITPPPTHLQICREASRRGIHIICQKPLAATYEECAAIVNVAGNTWVCGNRTGNYVRCVGATDRRER